LEALNSWVYTMGELGLAPVHPQGAYGNHSYRVSENSFVITRSGMVPRADLHPEDYCLVRYDSKEDVFYVAGEFSPSSECYLHQDLYRRHSDMAAIMHGHSSLFKKYAKKLYIPVTEKEFPYGTKELAHAAVELCTKVSSLFMLKNHGFVATGKSLSAAGIKVLQHYARLLELLKEEMNE